MTTIAMVAFPEFEALDLVGPLSMLASVPGFAPEIVAASRGAVEGTYGFTVAAAATFAEQKSYDVLFVPGGRGISSLLRDKAGLEFLTRVGAAAKYVTSVCTGSLALGAAGLLHGYQATTHWRYVELLLLLGALPTAGRVVQDRNRLTGGGVTAGMDFALRLIAEIAGVEAARLVQLQFEYNPAPPWPMADPQDSDDSLVTTIRARTSALYNEREQILRAL